MTALTDPSGAPSVADRPGGWGPAATAALRGRNLLKELDFSTAEFGALVDLAARLKTQKCGGYEEKLLEGRNIALIFEKPSTRTRCAFEVAAHDQGAQTTYLGPGETQLGYKESIADTARVLGRMYDGIEHRGYDQAQVEELGRHAGVPVWNGLSDQWHPTQMLADLLTMQEHSTKPFDRMRLCYLGDARNNTARSLLVIGAMFGMDLRIAAPEAFWPDDDLLSVCRSLSALTGGTTMLSPTVAPAVEGADFLYTDVWVSMGEPADAWDTRIRKLIPFQINADVIEMTSNPGVRVMHCLPALHNLDTRLGTELHERTGFDALEITDDVFESDHAIVFDQAENRLHTIKAVMVATLAD